MKTMEIVIGILIFAGVCPLIIGMIIPRERTCRKEFIFDSSVEKVWTIITDLKRQEKWRCDVNEVKIISDEYGNEVWTEASKTGPTIKFKTTEKIKNKQWIIEIKNSPSFAGKWIGSFEAIDENQTKVVFIESVFISNPFIRAFSLIFLNIDRTMRLYIDNLEKALALTE